MPNENEGLDLQNEEVTKLDDREEETHEREESGVDWEAKAGKRHRGVQKSLRRTDILHEDVTKYPETLRNKDYSARCARAFFTAFIT